MQVKTISVAAEPELQALWLEPQALWLVPKAWQVQLGQVQHSAQ
jgi:hypothetical protein